MSKIVDRFLNYVKYDTQSNESSKNIPSTGGQKVLAKALCQEMIDLGLKDVFMDENGYVMATLPSNMDKDLPIVGFIAHMDTSPDASGKNIKPQIVENYDGTDIILNKEENIILSPEKFPELKNYIGETLITTDGTTLLGADDKAGIAEILTALEYFIKNPEIKHGKVKIGFTPDEEIGRGADYFDVEKFGADFAYTVDGGPIGELQYENFNAAEAKINIKGINVHPGSAKNKMVNSILIAMELNSMLPSTQTPASTEMYEGFFHLCDIKGEVDNTSLSYIIRDHDKDKFNEKKQLLKNIVDFLKDKYGDILELQITDQYYNMKEKISPNMFIVETAKKAMEEVGIIPDTRPIRGGTDGARLSYMNLPCPNLFAGGHNFHGIYEYVPINSMEKSVEVIKKIIELIAK